MKKFFFFILVFSIPAFAIKAFAFTARPDSVSKWTYKGNVGLNISQLSFTNWAQGGDNSISWLGLANFKVFYNDAIWAFKNDLKISYGKTKLGGSDFRTTDNEIYLEDVLSYTKGWAVDPYVSNLIKTPIGPAYDYTKDPAVKIADFFDPGYVTQSAGFGYNKIRGFSTRVGIALQETFTNHLRQYSDDVTTLNKTEAFKLETGIESVTDAEVRLDDSVKYLSKFRLFTRFNHIDVWDVYWDNIISARVSRYFSVKFNFQLVYEKSQTIKTQFKEALLLGITYDLF